MSTLPNILIVDDSNLNLFFLESVIKDLDINIIKAHSGFEALEKTKGVVLALAILDVRMPGMNGYDLALRMNEVRFEEKVPIIFLTASHIDEIELFKGYVSGAVDYLFKPVDNNILISKINVFLDLYKQKQTVTLKNAQLKQASRELSKVNDELKKSEEKYRNYVENAPDGVFVANEKGRYIEVNQAASLITGYSRDELLNMNILDVLPEESHKEFMLHFGKLLKGEKSSKVDLMFKHKNGTNRWWSVSYVQLDSTHFLGFTKDITDERTSADLIRKSESDMTQAQRIAHLGNWEWDIINNSFKWSKEMYRIFDLEEETFNGKPESILKVIHPDDNEIFTSNLITKFPSIIGKNIEFRVIHRDGSIHTLYGEGHNEFDLNGHAIRILGTIQDITERKQAEDILRESEEHYRSLFDNLLNGCEYCKILFEHDKPVDIIYIAVNKAHESLTGLIDVVGKRITEVIPGILKSDPELLTIYGRVALNGIPESFEFYLQALNMWFSFSVFSPETGYIISTFDVITNRKQAEQLLKVSEEKYKTIINASPDGILLIDLNGVITEVSEIGMEIFGTDTRNEVIGKEFSSFVTADESDTIREIIEKTINDGLVQNYELKMRKINQSIFSGEISATLIQDQDGNPQSFMIITRDISQRKKVESKQLHADRMANLGEMATGIAHEINQPLNIISMVMDKIIFESEKTDTIDIKFLRNKSDKIFENIIRIRNIIDHIRAFSRSQNDYVLSAFDINSSIESAASMIMEQFKHLAITLVLRLEKKLPQILGNTLKFEQVIINLLNNAKDAVIEKKNKNNIYSDMMIGIETFIENQSIIVEVTDTGIGISNEDIHNIMLPFYTTKEEGKGTGIGLSICYQIIKEMNGSIEISSSSMEGTKIKIILDTPNKI